MIRTSKRISLVQLQSAFEIVFSAGPIPVINSLNVGESAVAFRQGIVYLQRFHCGTLGLRQDIVRWNHAMQSQKRICISQTGVGQRISRIDVYGLLEVFRAFSETVSRSLAPEISSLQVTLVRFEIVGVPARQALLLFSRKSNLQPFGNCPGNLFLYLEDLGHLSPALPAPDPRTVTRVPQLA